MNRRSLCSLVLGLAALLASAGGATPLDTAGPAAPHYAVRPVDALPRMAAAPFDREALRREDLQRRDDGLPPRFAVPEEIFITPASAGAWEPLDGDFDLWRLRVQAPGALSVNFGFTAFRLPRGGRLTVHPARNLATDDSRGVRVFTHRDNEEHGQLWTPVVVADDVVLELVLPRESRHDYELALTSINKGYRLFGEVPAKAGDCNIDVVCPEGDDWRREINSVAVYSTGGSLYCTGALVNNTAQDGTPYFLTANHCGVAPVNAPSLVVYWNFQSPTCGQQGGGLLTDFQTGAVHRANTSLTDFTLLELDDAPDPAHQVSWAGWNRAAGDFASAVTIHHPSSDEKSISFENDPTFTTSRDGYVSPGDGRFIRVADWDLGTTEGGSSGAPLFDPDHRIVGQLFGGEAACGNNGSDWFGRLSVSWEGGGTAATRLRDWLDPGNTGAMTVDTVAPWSTGLMVASPDSLGALGPVGGPFDATQVVHTLTNRETAASLDWSASTQAAWLDVTPAGGTLAAGASVDVTVAVDPLAAAELGSSFHTGIVSFVNLTDGDGDTTRRATLLVGEREVIRADNFDTNPGWITTGLWAFGQPTGGGGSYGEPDPTSGATGTNVFGYNLDGDYEGNLAEQYLMAVPVNCADYQAVVLRFQRWLGVEDPEYDHASVQVSAGGVTWVTVWENESTITDLGWTPVEIDLSAVADGENTVFFRWVMGTTDDKWHYCGWNIDDVEILGLTGDPAPVQDVPATPLRMVSRPNPFNPSTTVAFELPRAARARLEVFDTAGRKVATLVDRRLAAGPHQVDWRPRRLPSGVYVARLLADGETALQRMTLLK